MDSIVIDLPNLIALLLVILLGGMVGVMGVGVFFSGLTLAVQSISGMFDTLVEAGARLIFGAGSVAAEYARALREGRIANRATESKKPGLGTPSPSLQSQVRARSQRDVATRIHPPPAPPGFPSYGGQAPAPATVAVPPPTPSPRSTLVGHLADPARVHDTVVAAPEPMREPVIVPHGVKGLSVAGDAGTNPGNTEALIEETNIDPGDLKEAGMDFDIVSADALTVTHDEPAPLDLSD